MNKLEIKNLMIPSGYEIKSFFIDNIPLYEYVNEYLSEKSALLQSISPVCELAICWTDDYDCEGDAEFMKFILSQNHAITPILSCPDDFDFSCTVIIADIVRENHKVIWKRIGMVDHSMESYEEEKQSGILYHNPVALSALEWEKYIHEHWAEELYLRRINYTFPYYQNENHIVWFTECNFAFDEKEYDCLIKNCYPN